MHPGCRRCGNPWHGMQQLHLVDRHGAGAVSVSTGDIPCAVIVRILSIIRGKFAVIDCLEDRLPAALFRAGLVILVYELTSCRGHARNTVPGSAGILPA